uniref:Uncharacterized protein n=1 Tax=Candidatus Kentrum eta TaxID=2126337 RepID=A0A450VC18_9GAMM|nr:MAG: hypothetical protein BECKH772A_GA0070896_101202 [Candidatus Kentron sp. H]VFJ98124.1 MAG: hypothetical protein BECKH772B_GA0070898_101262 [Candidatus Kentron sp. H]VFK02307.1 MAG: hypothetical protein BECKH772C_GA0070978_100875 [Candidatus Kentron sp. H]
MLLELTHQFFKHFVMATDIHFAHQHLFHAYQSDPYNFLAQLFSCPICFLLDLGAGRYNQAFTFSASIFLGLFDNFIRSLMGLANNSGSLFFGTVENLFSTPVS